MKEWRKRILSKLDVTLVLFDLVLCAAFLLLSAVIPYNPSFNLSQNPYLRGVGVGLAIAGVTGLVACLYRWKAKQ